MRKTLLFLISATLLVGATACTENDDKYILGATPDERIQALLDEYQSVLCSAPYGWFVTVGTQDKGEAGGAYRFWMKFAPDNRVKMLGDVDATTAGEVKESSYRLKQMQHPTLMFDTYTYIHMPDDPGMAILGAIEGAGLLSDSDVSLSGDISGDEFRAAGRKRKCPFIFTRATAADEEAVISQRALTALKDTAAARWDKTKYPTISVDGFFIQMTVGKRLATFTYTDEITKESNTVFVPVFADMDANVRLVEPFQYRNLEFDKIVWNGKEYRVAFKGGDEYVVFDYTRPSYNLSFGPNRTYNTITVDKSKLNAGGGTTLSGPFLALYDAMYAAAASSSFFIQSIVLIFEMSESYDEQMRLNITYTTSTVAGAATSTAEATFRVNRRPESGALYFTGYTQPMTQVVGANMDKVGPQIANSLLSFLLHSGIAETGERTAKVTIPPSGNEFTVDWVVNNTPGLTSAVGGLYLTSDEQKKTIIPGTLGNQ
jgi:hypothetical protein